MGTGTGTKDYAYRYHFPYVLITGRYGTRYNVIIFAVTFGHYTSYLFPILLFANCNLAHFCSLISPIVGHKIYLLLLKLVLRIFYTFFPLYKFFSFLLSFFELLFCIGT